MIIRPARYQDKDAILRLLDQTGVFNEKELLVATQVFEDALRQTDREEYLTFCASNENEGLLGYICFGPITTTDNCYDLYWIAVQPSSMRRNIGKRLLACMEEHLVRNGVRRVYVDTSSTAAYEPARRFYEKHGYKLLCVLEDFYKSGDHRMIYMKEVEKVVSHCTEIACAGPDPQRN